MKKLAIMLALAISLSGCSGGTLILNMKITDDFVKSMLSIQIQFM